jgi:HAD superfamily hydrolase (TIGR01549 family)
LKTRAVFFDLGGTLLVMRRDRIFLRVLIENGRDMDLEKIHSAYQSAELQWLSFYGSRVLTPGQTEEAYRVLDQRVFSSLFPDENEVEARRVSREVRKRWPELESEIPLALYPDAEPTLIRLRADGYSLGVISNAPADTGRVVEILGISNYFDTVVISGAVGYSKPHPEIFRIALRNLEVNPGEALHVGDVYEADVIGARNAGVEGVLIDRDGTRPELDCPRVKSLTEVHQFFH